MIEHFGAKLKDHIAQHLTLDNYIVKNYIPSLPGYCEYTFLWYNKLPKTQMIDYYNKVLEYYDKFDKNQLKAQQIRNIYVIKDLLKILKNTKDTDYLKNLKEEYESKTNNNVSFEQYVKSYLQNKENFKSFYDLNKAPDGNYYSEKYIKHQTNQAIKNFNLNINYFKSLNKQIFNEKINEFIKNNPKFVPVSNLKNYINKSGYYIMILDNYCSAYIGTTDNISERIRAHWSKVKQFDRLIFPSNAVESSTLSIDSFKALDTTRIFAYETKTTYSLEQKFINQIPSEFLLNRIGGGKDLLLASLNRPNKKLTK